MKNNFFTILAILIMLNININAEDTSLNFMDNNQTIQELQTGIKSLDIKYNSLAEELKILNNSNIQSEQQYKQLLNNLETLESNTSATSNDIYKVIEKYNMSYNKSININKSSYKRLTTLQSKLKKQQIKLSDDFNTFKTSTLKQLNTIQEATETNSKIIKQTINNFDTRIKNTNQVAGVLDTKIDSTDKNVSKNMMYWLVAIGILTLFIALIFIVLKKQLFNQKNDLESDLKNTRDSLEEEGVKLDNKLIELLETQFEIIKNSNSTSNREKDHTLALKVADEIIRIQKNLTRMDEKTKGLKQLTASVKRIQDNFASNGYEVVEMLGLPYNDGMKVSASFIPDDDLDENQQIITRIIKPQVNYNGVMVQSAQIEVSQGQ